MRREIVPKSSSGKSQIYPEFGNIVPVVFTPVLAKLTKSFNLVDTLSVGWIASSGTLSHFSDKVESWRQTQITDDRAKLILYEAFVEGELEAPRSLLPQIH